MSTVTRWFVDLKNTSINDVHSVFFANRRDDPVAGVDRHSAVFATITEIGAPPTGAPVDFPFIGDAMLAINNVSPQDDGTVKFVVRVVPDFWDLNIRVQFLVSND